MIRIWLTAVGILFVFVELFQWIEGFILPLPVYVLAGAFLAIASNYEKGLSSLILTSSKPEGSSVDEDSSD